MITVVSRYLLTCTVNLPILCCSPINEYRCFVFSFDISVNKDERYNEFVVFDDLSAKA